MSVSVLELATRRKTIRTFSKIPVSQEEIVYCIKVAVQAPSGANRQPWRFLLIEDPKVKTLLREKCEEQEKNYHDSAKSSLKEWFKLKNITWEKTFLTEAPMILAVFSNQEDPYATESTWLAIGYILLALEEQDLSTVTYTPPDPYDFQSIFSAPKEFRLETLLPIGYSVNQNYIKKRRSYRSFIFKKFFNARVP